MIEGRFVKYDLAFYSGAARDLSFAVLDLSTGAVREVPASPISFVLSPYGTFAWIVLARVGPASRVFKSDSDGRSTLLARGDDIDPMSLERHGRGLSWTQGGRRRTGRLRRRPSRPTEYVKPVHR